MVVQLQEIIGEEKVSKAECERIWNGLLEVIVDEVKDGGEVKFGSLFKVFKKHKKARRVRNPKTGETFMKDAKDELGAKIMSEGRSLFEQ